MTGVSAGPAREAAPHHHVCVQVQEQRGQAVPHQAHGRWQQRILYAAFVLGHPMLRRDHIPVFVGLFNVGTPVN